jgi:hypothetical protein
MTGFWEKMNGEPWPKDGRPVSLTKIMTNLRKALVKTARITTPEIFHQILHLKFHLTSIALAVGGQFRSSAKQRQKPLEPL